MSLSCRGSSCHSTVHHLTWATAAAVQTLRKCWIAMVLMETWCATLAAMQCPSSLKQWLMLSLKTFTSLVRRLHVAGMAYSRLSIRHMKGNVLVFLSLVCVCVTVAGEGEERGQDVGYSGWRKAASWWALKLVQWKNPKPSSFSRGLRPNSWLEKMRGHLNHLSTVIENKCGASLTIFKHNPISVLSGQTSPLVYFGCWLGCCCCVFHPGRPEAEGGPNSYRPNVIDAYNTTFMDSRPFQLPSWNPLFCVPALSATSRCPLRDVAIVTQHGHKIVECFSIIWDFFLSKPFSSRSLH